MLTNNADCYITDLHISYHMSIFNNVSTGATYLRKKLKMIINNNQRAYFGHTIGF